MKLAVQIAAGILMAAGLLSGSSMAGPPLPTASSEQHGQPELEVTVEAQRQRKRIEREIQTFVTSLVLPRQDESLARWQVPICPVVAGMTPEQVSSSGSSFEPPSPYASGTT